MIDALYTAASGMRAQQTAMDVVANNLSNANTVGYKRDRVDQVDLGYVNFKLPSGQGQLGLGAAPGAVGKEMAEGAMQETRRDLDVAINGDGFLQVRRSDGTSAYTRAGNLQTDALGRLTTASGDLLVTQPPNLAIKPDATDVTIGLDGKISATVNGAITQLGQIQLYTFANPTGLQAVGGNLYLETANSGVGQAGSAASGGRGTLAQGYLESSNVEIGTEMIAMVTTQRSFEAASKVVSAADEMWGMANGMRR